MANSLYPAWKAALIGGSANSALNGTVKAALVDTNDYTYSAAHDFFDDIPGAAIVAAGVTLANKTFALGTFDADDITWSAVVGDLSEAVILYIDTGVAGTSRLVVYLDVLTGLPVTPSGADITLNFNAAGIFTWTG